MMVFKSSILAFRSATPTAHVRPTGEDRRPTDAEREYVRARARQAAKAMVEMEQRQQVLAPDKVTPCE